MSFIVLVRLRNRDCARYTDEEILRDVLISICSIVLIRGRHLFLTQRSAVGLEIMQAMDVLENLMPKNPKKVGQNRRQRGKNSTLFVARSVFNRS
jgi:hypothetical protein